uniref:Uncharacterized protein n=1 Tax=Zea mays TaxID=4577 RepID=A0A804PYE3_MAIZE
SRPHKVLLPPNALLPRARTRHHTRRRRRPRAHLYRQAATPSSQARLPFQYTARTHSPPTATAQRPSPAPPGRPVPVPSPPLGAAGAGAAAFVLCAARPAGLTKQSLSAGAGRTNDAAGPQKLREKKPGTGASSDVGELDQLRGFPGRVRPRLRRHGAHPRAPGLLRRARRRSQARPRRPRQAAIPKGAGRGLAAGPRVPAQRAARRGQAREGGRGRRAVPAEGGPRGARRVRGPAPRAPRHVRLLPRCRSRSRRGGADRHRRRVHAHLRGQGRRLDARRRRPLQVIHRTHLPDLELVPAIVCSPSSPNRSVEYLLLCQVC